MTNYELIKEASEKTKSDLATGLSAAGGAALGGAGASKLIDLYTKPKDIKMPKKGFMKKLKWALSSKVKHTRELPTGVRPAVMGLGAIGGGAAGAYGMRKLIKKIREKTGE